MNVDSVLWLGAAGRSATGSSVAEPGATGTRSAPDESGSGDRHRTRQSSGWLDPIPSSTSASNIRFVSNFSTWGGLISWRPHDGGHVKTGVFMSYPNQPETNRMTDLVEAAHSVEIGRLRRPRMSNGISSSGAIPISSTQLSVAADSAKPATAQQPETLCSCAHYSCYCRLDRTNPICLVPTVSSGDGCRR